MISSMTGMVSCKKYLDREPESIVDAETAFKDFRNFQGFTEELYNCIPDFTNGYWTNSWNFGEDEIQSTTNNFHFIIKVDQGDFWGWQRQFDGWDAGWLDDDNAATGNNRFDKGLWPLAWYGIRKCNLGLENMDLMVNATDEERDLIKGQLLFFRGWFHFQLMQYFGGLPYVDRVLPGDEILREPRLNYHETAEKAAKDFADAAAILPINWDNTTAGKKTGGKNQLRINKIMALSYLGKNYLWAASPLMNHESTGSKTYNVELAKKAANAFAAVLSMVEGGETQYALVPFEKYNSNFYTVGQQWALPSGADGGKIENIFSGPYWDAHGSTYNTAKQYTPQIVGAETVIFSPPANYVGYYGMKNGLPIQNQYQADPASGYDPQYPFKDRDPRFYKDIAFDGEKIVQGAMPANEEGNRYANLFSGGSYRDERTGSRTGFMTKKFVPNNANKFDLGWDYSRSLNIRVPYMRLSDVYLMYAEAVAAGNNNSATAKSDVASYSKTAADAINTVRARAGVLPLTASYLTPDKFMDEVRRERAVELSFEGHRFNDLRRWRLLTESPYTLKTSAEFDRAAPLDASKDPKTNKVLNYREKLILTRPFSEKHYWLPLKRTDVNMYPEFKQNPGW